MVSSLKAIALGLVVALPLAACGSGEANTTEDSGTAAAAGDTQEQSSPADADDTAPAAAPHVAVVAPRSDACAYFGPMIDNGIDLALQHVAEDQDFDLTTYDEGCVPEAAVAAVQRIVADERPDMVIGPAISGNVNANVDRLADEELPTLMGAYLPSLTQQGNEFLFRTVPHDGQLYRVLADQVDDEGHSTVGILVHASAYGEGARETFKAAAEEAGLETDESAGTFQSDTTDFSGQLLRLRDLNPDALFFAGYDLDLGLLVRQARQLGLEQPIFGAPTMANEEFFNNAGEAAEGVVYVSNFILNDPETADFAEEYRELYGEPATNNSVGYYIAGAVMADVFTRVSAGDEPTAIRDAIAETDIDTIFGQVRFDDNGDMIDPRIVLGTIEAGDPVVYEPQG